MISAAHSQERFCLIRQGQSLFGLAAESVREISPEPEIIAVPMSDPVLAGLVHLRNEFLPVLSLENLSAQSPLQAKSHLIVLESKQAKWALLAEMVIGLESLEVSMKADLQNNERWDLVILGSAVWNDQFVQVLDATSIYRLAKGILESGWSSPSCDAATA